MSMSNERDASGSSLFADSNDEDCYDEDGEVICACVARRWTGPCQSNSLVSLFALLCCLGQGRHGT